MLHHFSPVLLICVALIIFVKAQEWKKADLTNYSSYPECCTNRSKSVDQSECDDYSGCKYQGMFAFVDGKQSKEWAQKNNIIAIHNKYSKQYKLKTFELRKSGKTIKAKVYDECNDNDCNNCCTKNSKKSGFLIDIENYTMKRFGYGDGVVEWRCVVDC